MTSPAIAFDVPHKLLAERDRVVKRTRLEAKRREEKANHKKPPTVAEREVTNLCLILHDLAQKYVPRSAHTFRDFDALTQVTRTMQKMGLQPTLAAAICAPTQTVDNAIVFSSPEYRKLRNLYIAALATIADMPEKTTPPGSSDYQRGIREGYRRASDIAILFLEEIQSGMKR